jgi:TPP-dependent pyruvate/acetoin dehydrogenase alpha subunit
MNYKKEEIREYFDDYIKENKEYLEEDKYWKDELHYQAKQWLGDMVFEVIEHIREYEEFNFGEVYTDFSSPENVVNMYAYIIGEEIVQEYLAELEKEEV